MIGWLRAVDINVDSFFQNDDSDMSGVGRKV